MGNVNLGTVEFALVARAEQLEQVINRIRTLERQVNRFSSSRAEADQTAAKRMANFLPALARFGNKLDELAAKYPKMSEASKKALASLAEDAKRFTTQIGDTKGSIPSHEQRLTYVGLEKQRRDLEAGARAEQRYAEQRLAQEQKQQTALNKIQGDAHEFRQKAQRTHDLDIMKQASRRQEQEGSWLKRHNKAWDNAILEDQARSKKSAEAFNKIWHNAYAENERREDNYLKAYNKKFAQARRDNEAFDRKHAERLQQIANKFYQEQRHVATVNARARAAGISNTYIQANQDALKQMEKAVSAGDAKGAVAAQEKLKNALNATNVAIIGTGTGLEKLTLGFRTVGRAAILAYGPLSGVAARVAVINAIVESTGFKIAALVVGLTGLAVAVWKFGGYAIEAAKQQQRFDAVLQAATGSAATVGDAYQYALDIANKLGVGVKGLVEPYAKFATAAKLSGLSLEESKGIYEGAMTAAAAMRLDTQRTGLVFMALEQMVSKGTVSMEELRRQMGDLIPGSMAIAAKAMGKTQTELYEMIRRGDVLATDLLPKMMKLMKEIYGPAAAAAAKTLQAEQDRLTNSTFEFYKALDKATGASEGFKAVITSLRGGIDRLTGDMVNFNTLLGTVAGTLALVLIPGLAAATRGFVVALGALVNLTVGLRVFNTTATASVAATGLIGGLIRLAAVVGLAAISYKLLSDEQDHVVEGLTDFAKKAQVSIDAFKKIGSVPRAEHEAMAEGLKNNIALIDRQTKSLEEAISVRKEAMAAPDKYIDPITAEVTEVGGPKKVTQEQISSDPDIVRLRTKLLELKNIRENLVGMSKQLGEVKFDIEPPTEKVSKQWRSWINQFRDVASKYIYTLKEMQAARISDSLKDATEAIDQMQKLLEHEPEEKRGNKVAELMKQYERVKDQINLSTTDQEAFNEALKRANILTDSWKARVAEVYFALIRVKEIAKNEEQTWKDRVKGAEKYADLWNEVIIRHREATGMNAEELKFREMVAKKVFEFEEALKAANIQGEARNQLMQDFLRMWNEVGAGEQRAKEIEKVKNQLEQIQNLNEDAYGKIRERQSDHLAVVQRATELEVISSQKAAEYRVMINNRAFNDMLSNVKIFGKDVKSLITDTERVFEDFFDQIYEDGNFNFKKLLKDLEKYVWSFVTKMLVIRPLMQSIFGDMYTGQVSGGSPNFGLVGKFLDWGSSNVPNLFGHGTPVFSASTALMYPSAMSSYASELAKSGIDVGFAGAFATGGDFTVGGSGGTDSQLVQFMATPGEQVSVRRPDDVVADRIVINFTVNTNDASSFKASRNQILADLQGALSRANRNL